MKGRKWRKEKVWALTIFMLDTLFIVITVILSALIIREQLIVLE